MVPLPRDRCPEDGTRLSVWRWLQPALFFHGGYGAALLTVIRTCALCGWSLLAERSEVR